jgi:hypothetical protein
VRGEKKGKQEFFFFAISINLQHVPKIPKTPQIRRVDHDPKVWFDLVWFETSSLGVGAEALTKNTSLSLTAGAEPVTFFFLRDQFFAEAASSTQALGYSRGWWYAQKHCKKIAN